MNIHPKKLNSPGNYSLKFMLIVVFLSGVTCSEEPRLWEPEDVSMQIAEYINYHSDQFSEFTKLVKKSGMESVLSTRGPFTLFLPTNEAMVNYYNELGKTSADDFTMEEVKTLIRNHALTIQIYVSDIQHGSLSDTNALGDFLVSEYIGSEIYINKESKIIDRDVVVANGVIHVIDKVIAPVTETVYSILNQNPEYSIFTRGLELAGLKDTLDKIDIPFGRKRARIRTTILAVSDETYSRAGINSIDDLVAMFDDSNGDLTDLQNGFYRYMEFHCLEGTYYLSDFADGIYPVLSRDNYINFKIDTIFKIAYQQGASTFTSFYQDESNVPAKNGVIHSIDDILPVIEATPTEYIFQVTDFPDIKSERCYLTEIKNFPDGENTFGNIKWKGDYMQYYYKEGEEYIDNDCLSMNDGFWWLEVSLPKIMKGNYTITGYFKLGKNRANVVPYIDGERIETVVELNAASGYAEIEIAEVNWTETTEHTFKFVTIYPGIIYWDYLKFIPIEEE